MDSEYCSIIYKYRLILDSGTTWEYSTNSGSSWTNGSESHHGRFSINSQNYAKNAIQVRTTN